LGKKNSMAKSKLDPVIREPEGPVTLVAVSDLHSGSKSALCTPEIVYSDGPGEDPGSHRASSAQLALYECWQTLTKDWAKPDILLCCGDAIEGQARKDSGVGTWSTDLDDQVKCASDLLHEFNPGKVYLIDGTGYHVDAGGKSLERRLGDRLEDEFKVPVAKIGDGGARSADEVFLNVRGFTFHASHHISTGTGWYRTTPLARELIFALLTETQKHRVDIVLRGHVHYFCGVEFSRQRGYTLPCWQMQTRYMRKKSALGMMPDIGAVRFRIYKNELRMDKRTFKPIELKPRLFKYEEK
jgi:hypothetical protein